MNSMIAVMSLSLNEPLNVGITSRYPLTIFAPGSRI